MVALEVNDRMETVLHLAVSFGFFDMVEFLLELDCVDSLMKARDILKRKPIDIAIQQGKQKANSQMIMLLQQAYEKKKIEY